MTKQGTDDAKRWEAIAQAGGCRNTRPFEIARNTEVIGGSMSDDWNNIIANQTVGALWLQNYTADEIKKRRHAAVDALIGIKPGDELEGMIEIPSRTHRWGTVELEPFHVKGKAKPVHAWSVGPPPREPGT